MTAGGITIACIRTEAEFAALAGDWDDLVLAAARPSPFMLHDWLLQWWRHYGDGAELEVYVARRDGRLVAALPLTTSRRRGARVTEFVGTHASALGDLLVAPGEPETTAVAVADAARGGRRDLADLFGLPARSRLAAASPHRALRLIERVEAPVLDLSRGWETVYREKTDSKKRNLHKRRRRQLADQGEELVVRRARTLDELEPALEAAFELHERRWAGRPDGSGFATPTGRDFNRAVLRAFAAKDRARIVTLELDGHAIAFHYFFTLANRMYVYRLAFDPDFGRFSPGLVNTLDAIEAAGEEGLELVEFLGGDERYKLELADRLEPLYQGLGYASTPQGRLVVECRLAAVHARRRLKRSRRLRRLYFDGLAPARRALDRVRRATADA